MLVVEHGVGVALERHLAERPTQGRLWSLAPSPAGLPLASRLLSTLASGLDAWDRRRTARLVSVPGLTPDGPVLVTVAGVTRGGSWKTPFAVSLVEALLDRGLRCGLVMRGYRGRGDHARVLASQADARDAGDEAFAAFEQLGVARAAGRVSLAVGAVFADAARQLIAPPGPGAGGIAAPPMWSPEVIVVDGWRRAVPPEFGVAFVTHDAARAHRPAPLGLPHGFGLAVSAAGRVWVPVEDTGAGGPKRGGVGCIGASVPAAPCAQVELALHDAATGRPLDMDVAIERAGASAVLLTTHARPGRLIEGLRSRGFVPRVHLRLADHADGRAVQAGLRQVARRLGRPPSGLVFADKASLAMETATATAAETASVPADTPRAVIRCHLRLPEAVLAPILASVEERRKNRSDRKIAR